MPHAGSPNQSTLSTVYWTKSTHLKICTTVIAEYSTICNSQQNDDIILIIHSSSKNIARAPRCIGTQPFLNSSELWSHLAHTESPRCYLKQFRSHRVEKETETYKPRKQTLLKTIPPSLCYRCTCGDNKIYTVSQKNLPEGRRLSWPGSRLYAVDRMNILAYKSYNPPLIHCTNLNSFAADFLAPSAGFVGGKNLKTGYPPNVRKYGDYHRQQQWGRPVDFSRQRHWNGVDYSRQGQWKS